MMYVPYDGWRPVQGGEAPACPMTMIRNKQLLENGWMAGSMQVPLRKAFLQK